MLQGRKGLQSHLAVLVLDIRGRFAAVVRACLTTLQRVGC